MQLSRNRVFVVSSLVILASLILPRFASAQCGFHGEQFQGIAQQTGNAFVAEYSTNRTVNMPGIPPPPLHSGLKFVARDSEGRVRLVRSLGNYTVKSTDGVVTEVERLSIAICDPTTGVLAQLDTADKTATILPPRTIKSQQGQEQSFCANLFDMRRHFARATVEDLGQQTIAGYNAIGIRIYFKSMLAAGGDSAPSSYNELWCSDALGAILQQTNESKSQRGSELRTESTMQSIERREPEISLFQIPYDYTVLERAAAGSRPIGRRPNPGPAQSSQPQ